MPEDGGAWSVPKNISHDLNLEIKIKKCKGKKHCAESDAIESYFNAERSA